MKARARWLAVDLAAETLAAIRRAEMKCDVVVVDHADEAVRAIDGGDRFDVILCRLEGGREPGPVVYARIARFDPGSARRVTFVVSTSAISPRCHYFLREIPNYVIDEHADVTTLRALLAGRA
jgi:hypothetical protein